MNHCQRKSGSRVIALSRNSLYDEISFSYSKVNGMIRVYSCTALTKGFSVLKYKINSIINQNTKYNSDGWK